MYSKVLSLAAFASLAAAQSVNLTAALSSNPNLSNLTQFLGLYPQIVQTLEGLTNVTLLAPNNDAFTKLLAGPGAAQVNAGDTSFITALFTYHVLAGQYLSTAISSTPAFVPTVLVDPAYTNLTSGATVEAVTVGQDVVFYSGLLQNSTVTEADTNFTGGVIHVIDTFLNLPQNISRTLVALNETAAVGALVTSGVGSGPLPNNITAFMPNNAAFQAIGSALDGINATALAGVLTYHVVPDIVGYSTGLSNGMMLPTVAGSNLTITIEGGNVFVNSARVILPNILIKEGVIHIIDNVLNPANATAQPDATASTQMPAFAGASSGSVVPFTSGIPPPSSAIATPTAAASSAGGADASSASGASGAGSSSSTSGIAMPMKTGAVGAAALFGGAAVMMNL